MKHGNPQELAHLKRNRIICRAFLAVVLLVACVCSVLFLTKPIVAQETTSFKVTEEMLNKIPEAQRTVTAFNLSDGSKTAIDSQHRDALMQAMEEARGQSDVHFALIDLETGQSISYNIDEAQFGASAIKALYCSYVCQELIDTGVICTDLSQGRDFEPYFEVKELMRATVVESNNETYDALTGLLSAYDPSDWFASLGANHLAEGFSAGSTFPAYSVRDSLKLWFDMEGYFESTITQASEYLRTLTETVEVSYIRDGLKQTEQGANALEHDTLVTRTKAGYSYAIDDGEFCVDAICDAGFVYLNGHPYLVSVMTSLDCSQGMNRVRVENLVAAMFEALWSIEG